MNILHIAPNSPYNDYWGYQDNLLPKYQKKMGHEVAIIVPTLTHDNGKIIPTEEKDYYLNDGVRVIRKKYKNFHEARVTSILSYIPVFDIVCEISPDFIFYHGLISYTINDVVRYKKKKTKCIIVQDNHLDYNIGFKVGTFKEKIFRTWYRNLNKRSIGYVEKVYGVTPWRKKYAEDYFNIPSCKTDVLIMGADDEKVDLNNRKEIRCNIRGQYGIKEDEYLIVTGGKIDNKKGVDILAEACKQIGQPVKLMIFGQILPDIKDRLDEIIANAENIFNIGWIDADKVYNYFFAADLVMFLGQHSVLWEQACASKVPCVFKRWEGMDHVDNGGNSNFIDDVTVEKTIDVINDLLFTSKYMEMKERAESEITDIYLYSRIAKKSIECAVEKGTREYDT